MSSLLLNDNPLIILPTLATAIGLEQAIVLQQVHFLLLERNDGSTLGKTLSDGERYVYFSYEDWQRRYFPFMSIATIRRAVKDLEIKGLLVSAQPDGVDRRKYYRVGQGATCHLTYERFKEQRSKDMAILSSTRSRCAQIAHIKPRKKHSLSNIRETTGSKTTLSKNTTSHGHSHTHPPSGLPLSHELVDPSSKEENGPAPRSPLDMPIDRLSEHLALSAELRRQREAEMGRNKLKGTAAFETLCPP